MTKTHKPVSRLEEFEYQGYLIRRKRVSQNGRHTVKKGTVFPTWYWLTHYTVLKDGKTVGSFLKVTNARRFCRGELKGQGT